MLLDNNHFSCDQIPETRLPDSLLISYYHQSYFREK